MRQIAQDAGNNQEASKAQVSGGQRAMQMMTEYVNPLKKTISVRFSQLMPKMPSPMRRSTKRSPKARDSENQQIQQKPPHLDIASSNIQQRVSNFLSPPDFTQITNKSTRSKTTIILEKKNEKQQNQCNSQNTLNTFAENLFEKAVATDNS